MGGFEAAFKLDIVPALTAISISAEKTSASVGEKIALTVEAIPQGAELKDIIWSVDNQKIASIDDSGILSALSKGKVHVTASVKDNPLITNSIEIEVVVDAESLTISGRQRSSAKRLKNMKPSSAHQTPPIKTLSGL